MKNPLKDKYYWQAVLAEVLNKNNPDHPIVYTTVRNVELEEERERLDKRNQRRMQAKSTSKIKAKYSFNYAQQEIVFTKREMQVAQLYLQDKTTLQVAEQFQLTTRTVEYYTCNMRQKLGCEHKHALVKKLKEINQALQLWQ